MEFREESRIDETYATRDQYFLEQAALKMEDLVPEYRVHFSTRGKAPLYLTLITSIVLVPFAVWQNEKGQIAPAILVTLLLLLSAFKIRLFFAILRGAPAFALRPAGFWNELERALTPWNQFYSVTRYKQPPILLLEYPFVREPFLKRYLHRSLVKHHRSWIIIQETIQEPFEDLCTEFAKYCTIRQEDKAPKKIKEGAAWLR